MKNDLLTEQERTQQSSELTLFVVFTTVQSTLLSLQAVDQLTSDLATRIYLLVPDHAASSASSITPMMLADFTARYFLSMIPHAGDLRIKLTRYPAATEDLWEVLPPQSLIILAGTARRFRPSPEQRFAQQLRRAGHEVIFLSAQSLHTGPFAHSQEERKSGKKKSPFDFLKLFSVHSHASQG